MESNFLIIDKRIITNDTKTTNLYYHLLFMAYNKPVDAPDFGSITTTHRTLAREIGLTRGTLIRKLKILQLQDFIEVVSIHKHTIITINKANIDRMRKLKSEEGMLNE